MRREFDLPEADREYLDARGRLWETVCCKKKRWLIIEGFLVPEGYTVSEAIVALAIESAYPDTQIDMAYFLPALVLKNGRTINQLSSHEVDGRSFQRWSRHRTEVNKWRSDVDCVATHLCQAEGWLRHEASKL